MADVKPGDRVQHHGREYVVVDVATDEVGTIALLRDPADEGGEQITAVAVEDL